MNQLNTVMNIHFNTLITVVLIMIGFHDVSAFTSHRNCPNTTHPTQSVFDIDIIEEICLDSFDDSSTSISNNHLDRFESPVAMVDTTTEFNLTLCSGDAIVINGSTYDENNPSGVEIFVNSNGCDSIVNINLEFIEVIVFDYNDVFCSGYGIVINGTEYDENNPSGQEVFANSNGCDSIVNINLEFIEASVFDLNALLCTGDSLIINGSIIFNEMYPAGTITLTGASVSGCDSVININLEFIESTFTINGLNLTADIPDADQYQWLLNGTPISGATENTWTVIEGGMYALQIEIDGILCTSEEAFIDVSSVFDISLDPRISINPNPVQDQIFIHLNQELSGKIERYELINIQGQCIQKGNFQDKIALGSNTSGIYLFRLFDDEQNIYVQTLQIRS